MQHGFFILSAVGGTWPIKIPKVAMVLAGSSSGMERGGFKEEEVGVMPQGEGELPVLHATKAAAEGGTRWGEPVL